MNILLISPLPPPFGGIARWTEAYCKYCVNENHSVQIVNTAISGNRIYNNKKNMINEAFRSLKIFWKVRKALRMQEPDFIHISSSCSKFGLLSNIGCLVLAGRRKTVLHCHCNVEDQIGPGRIAKTLLSVVVNKTDKVLVLNQRSLDYMKAIGCKNVQIVPNFIEQEKMTDGHVINDQVQKIVFVGHIQRTKGIYEILEAAEQLHNIEFYLIGQLCEKLHKPVPPNIKMLGTRANAEVLECFDEADIFLFPSHTEGFSVALLEAMARGLPVIASDVGANREMLEDKGGIVIPARSSQAIVAAVMEMQDAQLRQRMSQWNIQKVAECYTADAVMQDMLPQMEELTR